MLLIKADFKGWSSWWCPCFKQDPLSRRPRQDRSWGGDQVCSICSRLKESSWWIQAPFSWTVPILSHHTMFVKTLFSQLHWWSTLLFLENWWLEWRSTMILWDQFFPTWTSSSKLQSPTTRSMSSTHSPDKDKHWSIFWRLPLESKLMMLLC